eukprot:m.24870 g.24870  ORF g.24870 m.24870 type:complete len:621 (-) comp8649_c0_seq1:223-2085(-)
MSSTTLTTTTAEMTATTTAFMTTVEPEEVADINHETDSKVLLMLAFLLFITTLVIWKFKARRLRFIHETGVSLLIGLLTGYFVDLYERKSREAELHPGVCNITARIEHQNSVSHAQYINDIESEAVFDPEIFFYVLLPPIIFFAGYDLKQKHFFRNIGTILLFAFVGTSIVCFVTGALVFVYTNYLVPNEAFSLSDCFTFGALISATDPVTTLAIFHDLRVDDQLYALVFGESVLNDAVAIVLYRAIEEFNPDFHREFTVGSFFYSLWVFILVFLGSFAAGTLFGMISSLLFKFSNIKKYPLLECTIFFLLSYASFLLGEAFGLSGIVAILFCGIAQAHYTYPCLSKTGARRTKELFELFNFLAENFIFSYVGLSVFTYKCHNWDASFISWSTFAILISRAIFIFPLSWLANCVKGKSSKPITKKFQFMLWWSGLRGAIAFALAMRNTSTPAHQAILSATLVIVIVTVMFFGGTTSMVINCLNLPAIEEEPTEYMLAGSTGQRTTKGWLATFWQGMDKRYIQPVISITPEMTGTDTLYAVGQTMKSFFKGQPDPAVLAHQLRTPVLHSSRTDPLDITDSADMYNTEQPMDVFTEEPDALASDFTSFAAFGRSSPSHGSSA